jgi:type II secretory ATPase GspE/PulE/Tfp pilus assembly ATPase PilB-like protein
MLDMGADAYLIAGVIVAILGQRLVRLNCPKCREKYTPTSDEIQMLKLTPEELETGKFAKGRGCPECRGTGYKGQIGVFELILGTPSFKEAIAKGADYAALNAAARAQGYSTMLEDGRMKVMQGWTTPEEVLKAVYTQALE